MEEVGYYETANDYRIVEFHHKLRQKGEKDENLNGTIKLLLLGRYKSENSFFYKGYMCLDVFKLITKIVMRDEDIKKWSKIFKEELYDHRGDEFIFDGLVKMADYPQCCFEEKDYAMGIVSELEMLMSQFSDILRNDKNLIMKTIEKKGIGLEYIGEKASDDHEIMVQCVKYDEDMITYCSERLTKDKEFVNDVCKVRWSAVRWVDKSIHNDDEFMKELCRIDKRVLRYCSDLVCEDKEFIVEIGTLHGAAHEVKMDKEVVLAVCRKDGNELSEANPRLRADKEVVWEACKQNGMALKYVLEECDAYLNENLLYAACGGLSPDTAREMGESVMTKELVIMACSQKGKALKYAHKKYQDDEIVVSVAVNNDSSSVQYASKRLQKVYSVFSKK